MKIVLAFDSFKGCMSAKEACHAAAEGVLRACPEATIVSVPLSDGGEGLVACVGEIPEMEMVKVRVHDPLMREIEASYAMSRDGRTAYMEMAAAAGLMLMGPDERDPMGATTYGVGEMLWDAKQRGCRRIVLGIGGSATTDGGEGMIRALRDIGVELSEMPTLLVASDVTNPLYGPDGAACIYAPQKGADAETVQLLDERLRRFAQAAEKAGLADESQAMHPGAGAAGGLGYGLMVYLGAELRSGIDIVLDIMEFDRLIEDADVVLTGEGKSDAQTLMGKVPQGVLRRAKAQGKYVRLLSGAIEDEDLLAAHFDRVISINRGDNRPIDQLMRPDVAKKKLAACAEAQVQLIVNS